MKRQELVRQPDGSYRLAYVDKGNSAAKANHGNGLMRKALMFKVVSRA